LTGPPARQAMQAPMREAIQPPYAQRQSALRAALAGLRVDAFLVATLPDVRYLCGFTGSNAALLIGPGRSVLFTDGRYTTQAREQTKAARIVIQRGSLQAGALGQAAAEKIGRCGIDRDNTTLAGFQALKKVGRKIAPKTSIVAMANPVLRLRQCKDAFELALMRQAAELGSEVYLGLLPQIEAGASEVSIAALLEHAARDGGAERMSFDTIVASGARSALPHGQASQARLPRRGFVTFDFGVILEGYCSDMTRTIHLGKASLEERTAYESVLEAQQTAVAAVKPGVSCAEVDEAARSVLRKAKLAKYFTHSTGHGVGLEIHEPPRIGGSESTLLEPGMVITIEPGVYMPGKFGVRIEDMVVVTETGHEVITLAPKGWTALA
jgi:Xaa-Pro aminopeptidase